MRPPALPAGLESAAPAVAPPASSTHGAATGGALRVLDRLGGGGSADVWRAADAEGRVVALKALKPELRGRAGADALLEREHELLVELRHPSIVASLGLIEHRGARALLLEYLSGGDLVALGAAPLRHWIAAVRDVLAALTHMHARGFVHRDVKARNVLFGADGRARLVDFASALPIGAPAPRGGTTAEHRCADRPRARVGPADDVFAFAVLLHELLCGGLPSAVRRGAVLELTPALADDGVARALAAVVTATLAAGGCDPAGLSAFADVIESATTS